MEQEDVIHYALHAETIWILATGFVLAMIESTGARIVFGVCFALGLAFAAWLRVVRKRDPGVPSIL
jgi:hypothetical protein